MEGLAIASLVLGILSLCAWLLPLCGFPVSVIGLVLGIVSATQSATRRNMAIVGAVLCGLGLVATLINAALGAYLVLTGQLFPQQ